MYAIVEIVEKMQMGVRCKRNNPDPAAILSYFYCEIKVM